MKRMLFVINTMGCAGAENALITLLDSLDEKEFDISLLVLMEQGEMVSKLPKYVRLRNKRYSAESVLSAKGEKRMLRTVIRAFFHNGRWLHKAIYIVNTYRKMRKNGKIQKDKLLWRVVSDGSIRLGEEFDLAVAYIEGGSAYYVADHVRSKKKAAFIHIDYESSGYTKEMDRDCFDKMDRIFTVSDEVKQHFLKVYPECADRIRVFHNIVDQKVIREKAQLPGGFADGYDGIRLLTVGRLNYQKAYDIAIDAMKLIRDKGYRVRWYVLGEGEERAALEKKISDLSLEEDFILLGASDNPYPYYAQCDIYVHASRFEGKSIAIQEAQTLGCAIIASDCNGNREQVEDGIDGLLCGLTPQEIADSVISLIEDGGKRNRIASAAGSRQISYAGEISLLTELAD